MTARSYQQRLRADSAEQTRRRILDAVADGLRAAPTTPISVERVAAAASVARSTVYLVFGSRSGLLDAFVEDLWQRTGLAGLTEAVADPDPRLHLRSGIAASCRMYATDRALYRALFSMHQLDPESVGGAVAGKENNRIGGMEYLAARLAAVGAVRPDLTQQQVVDILWVLCSFEAFDLLFEGRQRSAEQATELLVAMAERAIYAVV